MSFETALTGLNAASAELDVTGNNIANSGTGGFKYSRAGFADIFASSSLGVSKNAIGQGVRLANVAQQFSQGQFSFTGNSLDLAINGNGFFRMSDGGQITYTRAGSFTLDREGYIVDNGGRRLTGYPANANGDITASSLAELRINTGDVKPLATSAIEITANLTSGAEAPTDAFDKEDPDSYNFSTSATVYDSQGKSHVMTFYFVKDQAEDGTDAPNQWKIYTELDGGDAEEAATLTFNSDGTLSQDAANSFTANYTVGGGAADLAIDVDFSSLTQFGTPYSVTRLNPNGYAAGQFAGMTVEDDGTVFARYTNGQSNALGQIALSHFPSAENLQQVGDTSWVETFASGAPLNGKPGNSGLGNIQAGSLEQSNVNVTEQLINMITAQRNYQANAKMISTQDAITQEILNIR